MPYTPSLAVLLIAFLLTLFSTSGHAAQTHAAVAANFTAPMHAIAAAFEQQTGHKVTLSFGSSGKLFAQIQHGAPFDVFLSADTHKPQALIEAGTAQASSRFTYAIGTLALYSHSGTDARAQLQQGHFRKLAIANPRLAPYGIAATETLQQLQLTETTQNKLVVGENISQTFQFVASGNADLGFVALSQIIKDGQLPPGTWSVPASLHTPIRQDAVLLAHGQDNVASHALLLFLQSEKARSIMHRYGYTAD